MYFVFIGAHLPVSSLHCYANEARLQVGYKQKAQLNNKNALNNGRLNRAIINRRMEHYLRQRCNQALDLNGPSADDALSPLGATSAPMVGAELFTHKADCIFR
jgi:hypothetical protein